MIHKIKASHDEGRGLSIRAISRELGGNRTTAVAELLIRALSAGWLSVST